MVRRRVEVAGRTYIQSYDDEVRLSDHTWALVSAHLVDEITREPPRSTITVGADMSGLFPRVVGDGLVGLVGVPQLVFPNLAIQDYDIQVTMRAEGYLTRTENATIPSNPGFPNAFAPLDLGNVFLHREPIVIRGRTVLANGNRRTAIPSASVTITGVWRTLPPADMVVPADPPNLVSLRPPLYFPRSAATDRLRRREMTPVLGEDKFLLEDSFSGTDTLRLSDRINLASGDTIVIDPLDPDIAEYLTISFVLGASTDDQPATVLLTYPAAKHHRANGIARKVIPQAPGSDNVFDRDAIIGDTCVFLNSMIDLDTANVVEIRGGATLPEYHILGHFSVTSDADGYFRFPLLSRVAQVEIQADDGGAHPTITLIFTPNYENKENRIDCVFR